MPARRPSGQPGRSLAGPPWVQFPAMDFRVPPELVDLVASYRSFLEREVRPVEERFAERLQLDSFDEEMHEEGLAIRRRSAELGFYAAHMPEEVGGGGLSNLGYTLLVEAGAASGMQFASFALGPPNPAAPNPILMDLPDHLRDRDVPPARPGRVHDVLRAHRAGRGVGRAGHLDHGGAGRRLLGPERDQ